MTNEELTKILENHRHWRNEDCEGWESMRADLRGADLTRADLTGANLTGADLTGADLTGADLRGADLTRADLTGANLRWANLTRADLRWADLTGADLTGADLRGADLTRADLTGANLRWANLTRADLRWADLTGANLRGADLAGAKGCYTYCPSEGAFIGWKKAETDGGNTVIVKLRIPEDARRSSATTEKCRADKAEILEIQDMNGNVSTDVNVHSSRDIGFKYVVGEMVYPEEPFCEDRWEECASGIHFFIDRRAAVEY